MSCTKLENDMVIDVPMFLLYALYHSNFLRSSPQPGQSSPNGHEMKVESIFDVAFSVSCGESGTRSRSAYASNAVAMIEISARNEVPCRTRIGRCQQEFEFTTDRGM